MPRVVITCGNKRKREIEVADGESLLDVMLRENPETGNWPAPTVCVYQGKPLMRKHWESTRLTGDAVAVFAELPMGGGGGGGGSNPMRMILQVVVIAVAAALTWWAGGTGGAAAASAMGITQGALQFGAAIVSAVIMIGGNMLIGALFPPSMPSLPSGQMGAYHNEQASPTYNVNGSGNMARLGQPEPEGFGRMKITPDKIATEWAEYIDNEYFLYQVFGRGRGSYEVEALAFGDVVFWRNGHFVDSAYTPAAAGTEKKTALNVPLAYDGGWCAPVAAVPGGMTTAMLHVNMAFPDGIGWTETIPGKKEWVNSPPAPGSGITILETIGDYESGYQYHIQHPATVVPHPATVGYVVEYQEIAGDGAPVGGWLPLGSGQKSGTSTAAQSAVLSLTLPHFMGVQLRAKNTSPAPLTQRVMLDSAVAFLPQVEVQLFEAGEKVTLFPDNVEAVSGVASQELLAPNADGDWIGPFPLNSPGTQITKAQIDLILPRGMGRYNDHGGLYAISASVEFQYREIDDLGNGIGPWAVCLTHTFAHGTLTAIRRTFDLEFSGGRYEIKGRRTSDSTGSDGRTMDVIQWESAKAFLPGSLTYGQAGVAVKIKASNSLSQNAASNFTVIQTRKLPLYDLTTKTWTAPQPTRSYAAAISHIIKAEYGGNRKDKHIDLDALWGVIQPVLTQRGWNFDCWIDGPYNVWQLVLELSQAYLVVPRLHGSVISFVLDRPDRPVRHEFTPYNIVRGSFQPTWGTYSDQSPDDVQVAYLDEDAGFASRDVRAVLPESEGRKSAQKNYLGIVNRNHAHKIGMAYAARNRYRRLSWEFETEGMGRILNVGDVVTLNHPRLRDTAYGQVRGWSEESLTLLTTGALKVQDATLDLYVTLTMRDGRPWGPCRLAGWTDGSLTLDAEDYALLITQGQGSPFDWLTGGSDRQATVWTVQTAREHKRRVIITGVIPSSLCRYKITCINDDSRVDDWLDAPTPPWEFRTPLPEAVTLDAPEALRAHMGGTAEAPVMTVSWLPVRGAQSYALELSADGLTWRSVATVAVNVWTGSVPAGEIWVRVRARRQDVQGPWAQWQGNTTLEAPSAPVPVLTAAYTGARLSLSWPRVHGDPSYVVRIIPDGATAPVRTAPLSQTEYVYTPVLGVDDGGPWRKLRAEVLAVNEAGESPAGVVPVEDAPPVVSGNVQGQITSTSVTLSGVSVSGEHTGFVLARGNGPDFGMSGVLESRVVSGLPYTWSGLEPGTEYHFRIAATDAFFDVAGDFAELMYGGVVTLTTAEG